MSDKGQLAEDIILSEILNSEKVILLFNDNVNSFDHVIELCRYWSRFHSGRVMCMDCT